MATIEKECESRNCSKTVRYGIETINIPKYCSFECRDRTEGL